MDDDCSWFKTLCTDEVFKIQSRINTKKYTCGLGHSLITCRKPSKKVEAVISAKREQLRMYGYGLPMVFTAPVGQLCRSSDLSQ